MYKLTSAQIETLRRQMTKQEARFESLTDRIMVAEDTGLNDPVRLIQWEAERDGLRAEIDTLDRHIKIATRKLADHLVETKYTQ